LRRRADVHEFGVNVTCHQDGRFTFVQERAYWGDRVGGLRTSESTGACGRGPRRRSSLAWPSESGHHALLMPQPEAPTLIVSDAAAFRDWLDANRDRSDGVWLVLAKKNTTDPTSLTYAQALEQALCQGWIDGQKRSRDATTFA
jgi:hypothetical protein